MAPPADGLRRTAKCLGDLGVAHRAAAEDAADAASVGRGNLVGRAVNVKKEQPNRLADLWIMLEDAGRDGNAKSLTRSGIFHARHRIYHLLHGNFPFVSLRMAFTDRAPHQDTRLRACARECACHGGSAPRGRLRNFGLTQKSVQAGTPIELTIYFCSIFAVPAQVQWYVNQSRPR